MLKKITILSYIILCYGSIIAIPNINYVSHQEYVTTLKTTLAHLNVEKTTLIQSFQLNPEKLLLFWSPVILHTVLKSIDGWGNLGIKNAAYTISYGYSLLVNFHLLIRIIRLVYVFSDIQAIENELTNYKDDEQKNLDLGNQAEINKTIPSSAPYIRSVT